MDRLLERLRELGNKILEWWNRFTAKQKTLIVSGIAVLILAIVIIVNRLIQPEYILLRECETTAEAAEVRDLLEEESMTYTISDDGLTIRILREELSDANLLLGANNIQSADYTIDNVTSGSFSTTESDKQKRNVYYLERKLARDFMRFTAVQNASVELTIPENNGTLLAEREEASAFILLTLKEEFSTESAAYLARAAATAIGNETTDNIVIMDSDGNMLFTGDDNYSLSGTTNAQLSAKTEAEKLLIGEVRKVLLGTGEYDNVEVATNLVLDFSTYEEVEHTYTPADGQTQGVLAHEDLFESENESGVGGIPGTDSNDDDTTYVLEDNGYSHSSQSEQSRDYLPNERIRTTTTPAGLINYSQSSITVALLKYNVIREEDARTQGLLDGITWDEYKLANKERTRLEVDDEFYEAVANATGISSSNVSLVAYSENVFFDREGSGITATDVLQIILIIVILALLAFVVLRSMRGEKHEEEEEELTVEGLLQSMPETAIEEISLENETDERKMINKFVEENPEAVANLLRNWLNEEWG